MVRVIGMLLALTLSAWPAQAQNNWIVAQSMGKVSVSEGGLQEISVRANASLSPGSVVATGDTGQAVLVRGEETITLKPGTRLMLPAAADTVFTKINQEIGRAIFSVGKKPQAHFEVETPYLAAVVKGTTFEVSVDAMGATVAVTEGAVAVSAFDGGDPVLTTPGFVARVNRDHPNDVQFFHKSTLPVTETTPVSQGGGLILTEVTPEEATNAKEKSEGAGSTLATIDTSVRKPVAVTTLEAVESVSAEPIPIKTDDSSSGESPKDIVPVEGHDGDNGVSSGHDTADDQTGAVSDNSGHGSDNIVPVGDGSVGNVSGGSSSNGNSDANHGNGNSSTDNNSGGNGNGGGQENRDARERFKNNSRGGGQSHQNSSTAD